MRRPAALVFALSCFACHVPTQTRAPEPATTLNSLIDRIAALPEDPSPDVCAQIDAGLAVLHMTELGREADYARAEAALRCGQPDRWKALHEQLAEARYLPSLARLGDDAVALGDWDRAIAIVLRIAELSHKAAERQRMQALELRLIHARWIERGDPKDFARLEREARIAIVRNPKQIDARADLIRLYAEQAAISGDLAALRLAQITEQEARKITAVLGREHPKLSLVSGFVRELEGDRPAAVAAWTRALELNPALVEPRLWLGLAAFDRRDYALAQAHLAVFVEVHPDHVDALLAYGAAALGNGDPVTANLVLERASKLAPDDPRALWNIAFAHGPYAKPNDWDDRDNIEYLDHLDSFIAAYERLGPRDCPPRGDAGPDPACVRAAAALELSYADALTLVVAFEYVPFVCELPARDLVERERPLEEHRREQLLDLERQALEAGSVPAPTPD